MKIVVDIPESLIYGLIVTDIPKLEAIIDNGIPLSRVITDLLTELSMNVDGGTDDKYVRTCDVIDRIEKTVQEFMETLDGEGSDK